MSSGVSVGSSSASVGGDARGSALSRSLSGSLDGDPDVTHARGVIDDVTGQLAAIRSRLHPENVGTVRGGIDDVAAAVERLLDEVVTP